MSKQQVIEQFDSIESFYKYICDTPFNEAFRWEKHSSVEGTQSFTKSPNFSYAVTLMKNGWYEMAETLTQKLKVATKHDAPVMKQRNVLSVSGYQPVVPLYLAGVPTNMINKQMVAVKSKIINVTKLVNYNCGISTKQIEDESIKALQIVKKLEAQGYRCNLYIALGVEEDKQIVCKVKIKNANERLNISKLAFPMVHPSMLRRLFFRFIEVHPEVTKQFVWGYGRTMYFNDMKKAFPNDIVIPSILTVDVDKIKDLESLKATV